MKPIIVAALASTLFSGAQVAHAQPPMSTSEPVGWEIAPFYGYRFGGGFDDIDEERDTDFDLDSAPAYGLIVEFPSGHHTQWHVFYSRQDTELDIGDSILAADALDLTIEYFHVGGTYVMDGDRDRGYVGVSFGGTRFSPEDDYDDEVEFSMALLGGIKYRLTEHVGLRFDGRLLGTLTDSDSSFFCAGGCVAKFDGNGFAQWDFTVGLNFYL
jgi:opacity protein-like surface antigen